MKMCWVTNLYCSDFSLVTVVETEEVRLSERTWDTDSEALLFIELIK